MAPSTASAPQLPAELSQRFLAASQRRRLAKGAPLFSTGSSPRAMFMVLQGQLQVSIYASDGRQFFASLLGPGEWFGEVPLLDDSARAFHAEALVPTDVAVLNAEDFWGIVEPDGQALLAVVRLVCSRFRQAVAWIEDASLRPFDARLAGRLLAMAARDDGGAQRVTVSQEMLAAQLGVARQTVNRQLQVWRHAGIVRLGYGAIELTDAAALRAVIDATQTASSR